MHLRVVTLLLAVALGAAACSEPEPVSDTNASPTRPSTTMSPGSTTVPATTITTTPAPASTTSSTTTSSTTTTSMADRFSVVSASIFPAEPLPGSNGAGGSGCTPGGGDLPGGIWYGTIVATDDQSVDFDLACFYFGDIAWEKAAAVGEEASNDYWIVNDNPGLRTVRMAANAVVWSIPPSLSEDLIPLSFSSEWPPDWQRAYSECPGDYCRAWLYVNDGVVDEIVEQYTP